MPDCQRRGVRGDLPHVSQRPRRGAPRSSPTLRSSAPSRAPCAPRRRGETVIEPRVHLEPDPSFHGHFNILRGYVAPTRAGRSQGCRRLRGQLPVGPSFGDWRFSISSTRAPGRPVAVLDATAITEMRTGAITALGARHLARSRLQGARPSRLARYRLLERAPGPLPIRSL